VFFFFCLCLNLKINTDTLLLILFDKINPIYTTTTHSSNYNELASFFRRNIWIWIMHMRAANIYFLWLRLGWLSWKKGNSVSNKYILLSSEVKLALTNFVKSSKNKTSKVLNISLDLKRKTIKYNENYYIFLFKTYKFWIIWEHVALANGLENAGLDKQTYLLLSHIS